MTKLGLQKLHICPKVIKMGSLIGHRVDYNGVGGPERPAAHTQQKLTQVPPTSWGVLLWELRLVFCGSRGEERMDRKQTHLGKMDW